ncbi:MAG: Ltp family lipoprotein [Methanomicrobium sp.]|nr:Ltp family lipoprotein [Methanomicrobium sp.]
MCQYCDQEFANGAKFCRFCGNNLENYHANQKIDGNVCSNCGNRILPGAAFCNACGNKVGSSSQKPLPVKSEPETFKNQDISKLSNSKKICNYCGNSFESNLGYCTMCGKKVNTIDKTPDSYQRNDHNDNIYQKNQTRNPYQKQSLAGTLGIIILAGFVVLFLILIAGNIFTSSPQTGTIASASSNLDTNSATAIQTSAPTVSPTVSATTVTKTVAPTESIDIAKEQAVKKAESYLSVMPFSYEGLITQLEYEKFTHEQAVYGADNCDADWSEQAVKKGKSYLSVMPFSYEGLITQLEYDKFTPEQAVYGADNCDADWSEQAVKKGKSYLSVMSFSYDGLISQLEYDKFTHEQAVYGADQNF